MEKTPEFKTPQELADYYSRKDATRGMIVSRLHEQFGVLPEEADALLTKAKLKESLKTRARGLKLLGIGIGIIVAVSIVTSIIVSALWKAGYFPGLPLWALSGGGILAGVIFAFQGLMQVLSGTETE